MPHKPMNEDDPLVPKQVSLRHSLTKKLEQAVAISGKSESEIVRDALTVELKKNDYNSD